jgi:hypothetical protein
MLGVGVLALVAAVVVVLTGRGGDPSIDERFGPGRTAGARPAAARRRA